MSLINKLTKALVLTGTLSTLTAFSNDRVSFSYGKDAIRHNEEYRKAENQKKEFIIGLIYKQILDDFQDLILINDNPETGFTYSFTCNDLDINTIQRCGGLHDIIESHKEDIVPISGVKKTFSTKENINVVFITQNPVCSTYYELYRKDEKISKSKEEEAIKMVKNKKEIIDAIRQNPSDILSCGIRAEYKPGELKPGYYIAIGSWNYSNHENNKDLKIIDVIEFEVKDYDEKKIVPKK